MRLKYILTIILLWFSGCSNISSHLIYNNHSVYIKTSNTPIILKAQTLTTKNTNFVSLYLKQQLLQISNKETIVYEQAITNLEYEFEPTLHRIISVIFDTSTLIPIYNNNNLYVYQIILPNHKIINIIIHYFGTQELYLLYGMSNKTLYNILHNLDTNIHLPTLLPTIKLPTNNKAFITKWNDWNVHFVPLVVPLARLMMPF